VSDHDDEDDDDSRSELQHIDGDIVMGDDVLVEDASDVEGAEERVRSRDGLGGCFGNGEQSRKA
jgi:ADA HAT complex component 1